MHFALEANFLFQKSNIVAMPQNKENTKERVTQTATGGRYEVLRQNRLTRRHLCEQEEKKQFYQSTRLCGSWLSTT
jgi:hypothetical protein